MPIGCLSSVSCKKVGKVIANAQRARALLPTHHRYASFTSYMPDAWTEDDGLLYELRVRDRDRELQGRVLAWDELPSMLNLLRAEHGLGVDFELFYNGRCVLTEQQIECFF